MSYSLSENIKKLRTSMEINQVDFAKKLNVSKQCISNWENDNVQPSIEMLEKIADFFSVSTDMLLGRSDDPVADLHGLTEEQSTHIRMIIRDFRKANSK